MRAEDALILSKRFTRDTAEGGGAIKGKDGFPHPYPFRRLRTGMW